MWNFLAEDISVGLSQHHEAILRRLKNTPHKESAPGEGGGEITTTCLSKAKIKTSDYLNLCFRIKWFYNTYVRPGKKDNVDELPDYPK